MQINWWEILADLLEPNGFYVLPLANAGGVSFEVWKWWLGNANVTLTVNANDIDVYCWAGLFEAGNWRGSDEQSTSVSLNDPLMGQNLQVIVADWLNARSGSRPGWIAEWWEILENLRDNYHYDMDARG